MSVAVTSVFALKWLLRVAQQPLFTATLLVGGALLLSQGFYMDAKAKVAQVLIEHSWQQRAIGSPPPKPWWWADTKAIALLEVQKDESYIYSCVRKLSSEKGLNDVTLYGMPILLDSKRIEFDHYRNLRMKIARAKFVERKGRKVQQFRKRYYDTYKALPSDDAYEGYDMMVFIGRSLARHGNGFQYQIDSNNWRGIQASFDVQKVFKTGSDDFKDIQFYENKNVDIIGFENNKFKRLR